MGIGYIYHSAISVETEVSCRKGGKYEMKSQELIEKLKNDIDEVYNKVYKEAYNEIVIREEYKTKRNESLYKIYEEVSYEVLASKIKKKLPFINQIFRTKIVVHGKMLNYKSGTITATYYFGNNTDNSFECSFYESDFKDVINQ